MTRELFQAPCTGTPQHWDDFRYRQARCACQRVLDLRNTQQEVESQLLSHHLYVIRSQNLSGLALERARDEVMQIYGRHLETEVEPFRDYLRAVRPEDTDELDIPEESEISSSIMDLKHSGPKKNTSDCASNCEDTGTPPRPGMIYSVLSYAAFHERWSLITRV